MKGNNMTKELIEKYAKIDYPDNQNMQKYIISSTYDVIELSNGMLCEFGKPHIATRFCFSDEGPEYDYYKELKSDENHMKSYFLFQNTKELDEMIEVFEGKDSNKTPCIYDYENGLCKPSWNYFGDVDKNRIELPENDKKLILEKLYEVRKSLIKRLETWWKKYGAEKLHTWTYWANA